MKEQEEEHLRTFEDIMVRYRASICALAGMCICNTRSRAHGMHTHMLLHAARLHAFEDLHSQTHGMHTHMLHAFMYTHLHAFENLVTQYRCALTVLYARMHTHTSTS